MKKTMIIASLFLLSVILAGCMSIPGFSKEDTDPNVVPEETEVQEEPEEMEIDESENEEAVNTETTEENGETESTDASATDSKTNGECEDDYSVFLEELPDDFPMPECAIVEGVLVDNNRVDASYEVEGDWSDLYSFYKDYLEGNIEEQNQILNEEKGRLVGLIDDGKIEIDIKKTEDNYTAVRVFYKFP